MSDVRASLEATSPDRRRCPTQKWFISFYNTHAQAAYRNAPYLEVRKSQMAELAPFINDSRGGYETTLAMWSKLAPNAGDLLADVAIHLIERTANFSSSDH